MIAVSAYCYLTKYQPENLLLLHVANDELYTYKLKISNKFKDIDTHTTFLMILSI